MPSLIESIVSLEQQANDIVAKAHDDAKAAAARADAEIADARKRLAAETDARLAAFESETAERQARELAEVDAELRATLSAIDAISPETIRQHAARVVQAFQEG